MPHKRRAFIQGGIVLSATAGLALTETAANNVAEEQPAGAETEVASPASDAKAQQLASVTTTDKAPLTTNVGQPISTDQNTLRAGARGPALLEDFILREKIQHFDHERIPERIVHARGAAAHGYFAGL